MIANAAFVSVCCEAPIRFEPHEGGSSPVCKKCDKRCNSRLPKASDPRPVPPEPLEDDTIDG